MNTFRIAWRNLWRNTRRTTITLIAMALSTAVLIITYALMLGMIQDMERSVTDVTVGQVQVHHPDYLSERSIYDTVSDHEAILTRARHEGISAAPRAFGYGLLSSGTKSAGVQFWGVSPSNEREVGSMPEAIFKGSYLPDAAGMQVVLGRKLARTLGAEIGTELVAVVQAADGSLGNDLFTVAGVFKSIGEGLDRSLAVIKSQDFADLFVLSDQYHEISLNSHGALSPEEVATTIEDAAGDNEVETWHQIMPAVSDMLKTFDGTSKLFLGIFFLAAALGVLNTMLMATYERIPEFGLLKAIGSSPWRILRDVLAETFVLGVIGSLIGGLLGTGVSLYFQVHPIDLSGFAEGFSTAGIAMSPLWYAELTVDGVVWPVVILWIVSVLSALYPALKAARLDPVGALTHV
ncbi:MAG: ABC transporter permease [Desulfomonilia bacterium]